MVYVKIVNWIISGVKFYIIVIVRIGLFLIFFDFMYDFVVFEWIYDLLKEFCWS